MGKRKIAIQNPDTGEISYLMTGDGSVLYAKNSGLKILTDINMSGNAVDNIVISEVDGLPTTGKEGQITYYDGSFYCCNGKIWSKMSIVGEETIDEGEIFNDYDNNRAISKYSASHGSNNLAGAKAFKITAFGTTDSKTYTLDSVEGLEVGDVFSVHLKNEYDNYGKIVSINPSTKTVTVDNFKEAETATEGNPVLNIFRIAAKPEVGTTDFAVAAFAEGSHTKAVAEAAHSEGGYTKAMGHYSHTEGYNTIANNDYQHVQGKYNIEDTNNKYAHIIGNGSSNKRSNAHTIDWEGNAWFAGKVTTGNTQEELATKLYVDSVAGDISNTYYIDINEGISSDEWAEIMTIPNFSPSKTYIVNNRTYGGNQVWEILILNEEHNMRDEDDTALAIKHTTLKLTSEGKLLAKAGEYWGTVPKTVGLTMRLIIVDSSHVITSLA